jgi:hypothetical protein
MNKPLKDWAIKNSMLNNTLFSNEREALEAKNALLQEYKNGLRRDYIITAGIIESRKRPGEAVICVYLERQLPEDLQLPDTCRGIEVYQLVFPSRIK